MQRCPGRAYPLPLARPALVWELRLVLHSVSRTVGIRDLFCLNPFVLECCLLYIFRETVRLSLKTRAYFVDGSHAQEVS